MDSVKFVGSVKDKAFNERYLPSFTVVCTVYYLAFIILLTFGVCVSPQCIVISSILAAVKHDRLSLSH